MTGEDQQKLDQRNRLLEQMEQIKTQLLQTALFPIGFTFDRWGKPYKVTRIFIEDASIRYVAHRIHNDGGLYRRSTMFSETELALMPGITGKLATKNEA